MSKIKKWTCESSGYNYFEINGKLVPRKAYEYVESLERQLAEAREVIKGIDRYIEAECQEAWSNNWEGREGAFVDIAKKLKKLKEQGQ